MALRKKSDKTSPKEMVIEQRRAQVADMYFVQGLTQHEIAASLGKQRSVIQLDLEVVKRQQPQHLAEGFAVDLVNRANQRIEAALQVAMDQVQNAKTPSQKLAAAKAASEIIDRQVKLFQDLGIVERAATVIDVGENARLKSAFLHFLAQKGLTNEFTTKYGAFLTDETKELPLRSAHE